MHLLLVNTWGTVAPLAIHVIIVTRTTLLVGIVIMVVVVTVAIVTRTAIRMAETETGAIVEAPLLLVVAVTPLIIGVAGVTPVAHPLEAAALHPVVVVVAPEITTHQPPQQVLLQLQHPLLIMRGGNFSLHPRSGRLNVMP